MNNQTNTGFKDLKRVIKISNINILINKLWLIHRITY